MILKFLAGGSALAVVIGLSVVGIASPAAAEQPSAITVGPTGSVQDAIDAVAPGGVVTLTAGTYRQRIDIIGKSMTLKGAGDVGSVILEQPVSSDTNDNKLIDIHVASNVTLENLTLHGSKYLEQTDRIRATGIDANGVDGLTLNNVTVKGFVKNGITLTSGFSAGATGEPIRSGNVMFNTVTADGNRWAGIAFYTVGGDGVDTDIPGVRFTGITTITGNPYGIQFGEAGDTNGVRGANGGPVSLGIVAFNDNRYRVGTDEYATNVIVSDHSVVQLAGASTVDGRAAASSDFLYAETLTLVPSVSTSTVAVSPSGSALTGTAVTVTGTVSPAAAVGTIKILDDGISLGEGTATGGVFTVVTSALAVGSHSLTAKFTPANAENYQASTSTAVTFSVNKKELPADPPSTNTDQLEVLIETQDLDVSGTTDSFVPSGDTTDNPLDSLDVSKTFSGTLPWSDGADSFVDVYAYSSPVFLGTFPVVNGKVQITGIDLSALQAGGHHLVFVGQTSETVSVMAIVVEKGGLAVTGVDPAVPIGAAGILLLLGLGLLIVVARRRLA